MRPFQLLAGEDQALLIRWDGLLALLVLDLGLDVVDDVGSLDIKKGDGLAGQGLAGQGLHKDPHTTTKAQHEVEGGLLLGVAVRKRAAADQVGCPPCPGSWP